MSVQNIKLVIFLYIDLFKHVEEGKKRKKNMFSNILNLAFAAASCQTGYASWFLIFAA